MDLTIVTPALHRGSGTEKCMSWLVEDLSAQHDVKLVTGFVRDTDVTHCRRVHKVLEIKRPRLLRYLTFLYANTALFLAGRRGNVLTTSGDCWFGRIIYAHFCCAAWLQMISRGDVSLPSDTPRRKLRNLLYRCFLRVAAWHERRMYHRGTTKAVVAVSAQVKREIIDFYGVSENLIHVVPNAADDRVRMKFSQRAKLRYQVRRRYGIAQETCVLLFVAAGDWKRKGLDLLLEAAGQMRRTDFRVLVAGNEDITHYRNVARRHKVEDRVIFAGSVRDVADVYAAGDVFVYPSLYEAFPLVLLEAAAAGLALLVTPMGGVEELNANGDSAVVVERSPAALAAAMDQLVSDPRRRQELGAKAAGAAAPFTRRAVANAIAEIVASVAG